MTRARIQGGNTHEPKLLLASTPASPLSGRTRARVMLVAAKCLAQEKNVEEALACTREVRALAGRRSALPGGSSGVTSTVTHEAFKLEV